MLPRPPLIHAAETPAVVEVGSAFGVYRGLRQLLAAPTSVARSTPVVPIPAVVETRDRILLSLRSTRTVEGVVAVRRSLRLPSVRILAVVTRVVMSILKNERPPFIPTPIPPR